MKRIIALLLIMLIAVGCESKASADYLWNISVDDIEKVEIQYMDYTFRTKEIELSDGISLINTLNKIKRTEVDFEKTNIERIRDVQSVYKFRNASKLEKQKK